MSYHYKVGPKNNLYMELWGPYKWPYEWLIRVITLLIGVWSPVINIRLKYETLQIPWFDDSMRFWGSHLFPAPLAFAINNQDFPGNRQLGFLEAKFHSLFERFFPKL